MGKRFAFVIGAAALGAALIAVGASANFRSVGDPRGDTTCGHEDGGHKPCSRSSRRTADIVGATAGHGKNGWLKHTIRVVGKFDTGALTINTDSDPLCEFVLGVFRGSSTSVRECAVDGPSAGRARYDFHRHSVEIFFSERSIGNPQSYGWGVSTWAGDRRVAHDFVPHRRHRLGDSGVAAAGVMALGAQTASAGVQQLSCGDTITTDTTLHKNLVDCPNNGIVIGANGITLDLNGHTIDGDGTLHCGPGCPGDSGVSISLHDGITVKNGSIRQFEEGVGVFGARHIRLLGLAASRNLRYGIALSAAARILIRNCSVNRTTASTRDGSVGLLVTSGGGPILGGRSPYSHHVRIVNSSFRHNAGDGIVSFTTRNSVIKGNLLSRNRGTAIAWHGGRNRLTRNRVIRNRADGIVLDGGFGNLLARNVIAGGATSIQLRSGPDGHRGAVNTVVRGNRLRGADRDGVLVESGAKHTLLRNNSARGSQDDGFDVNDRATKLSRNRAVRNRDLGIEAVRGVNDGDGNKANGNGDRRQCTHVACS